MNTGEPNWLWGCLSKLVGSATNLISLTSCIISVGRPVVLDHHNDSACGCDFKMPVYTNFRLKNTFLGWHNVENFILSTRNRQKMYVPRSDWWDGWEATQLLLVSSSSVFSYYSSLLFPSSKVDKTYLSRIGVTEFLMFAMIPFVTAPREGVYMSQNADLLIVCDFLSALLLVLKHLACWITELGLFTLMHKKVFVLVLAYFAFCCWQKVQL